MVAPLVDEQVWTVGRLLEWTAQHFTKLHLDSPRLDAEVLLAHVLGCRRIDLYVTYDEAVSPPDRASYRELVKSRAAGCPVAYLVGSREFYCLPFQVDRRVLIPRPETEHVVIEALQCAKRRPVNRFLDLCTGSGAIAITLAIYLPQATGVATDLSADALAVARSNAERHNVADRLTLVHSDLFAELPKDDAFDLIVSNPPYVASADVESLPTSVRDYEPRIALDGGPDGTAMLRRIVEEAPRRLVSGGSLVVEIGAGQETPARAIVASVRDWEVLPTIKDLAGVPRVLVAIKR